MVGSRSAVGPMWVGGDVTVLQEDEDGYEYSIKWFPDKNNEALREADDKRMVFYFMVDRPRLAKDRDGDYKFHLQKFQGVMNPDVNIGHTDYAEVAGGYLNLTTTLAIPDEVMAAAQEKLKEKLESSYGGHPLLAWDEEMEPRFAPVPITDHRTKLDPLSATERGGLASPETDGQFEENLPAWGWDLRGDGKGSLNPLGTNAFSAMMGAFPVSLIEGAAKSGESNLRVASHITYNTWVPEMEIAVEGDWQAIHTHFSAEAEQGALFSKAEISTQLEYMRREGHIDVEINYNEAWVDEEQINAWEAHADEIATTFLEIAKETILEREEPTVESASAEGGPLGLGGGFSVKAEADIASLEQTYVKTINRMVEKTTVQSATLTGLFDEFQENPEEAEERYFSDVYLSEAFEKLHVVARSNANWDDPIDSLAIQIGYPTSEGDIRWHSTARFREGQTDTETSEEFITSRWTDDVKDRVYIFDMTRREASEIEGRDPSVIDVKKQISFERDPRVFVDSIEKELQTDKHILEVSPEVAGAFEVGPISLDTTIENDPVVVRVKLRNPDLEETFEFDANNYSEPRFWRAWYESPEDIPPYEYQVKVVVKGSGIMRDDVSWTSDWTKETGSGSLLVDVPPVPEDKREAVEENLSQ